MKLLADIKRVFDDFHAPFLSSGDLVAELRRIEDSPWDDFDYNPSKLAFRLKDFGVKPGRNPAGNVRGYSREALSDVFERYLRQTPSDPSETDGEQPNPSDTRKPSDTLTRQTEMTRQNESPARAPFLTGLTPSDDPPAESVPKGELRNGFCPGCGTYYTTNGEHRDDCTATRKVAR
ncbi:MAG: hypothetical protein QOC76_148 [Mycobacterium sp.]|nr:hypothetical protein [Mycobacterium sp.]